jgi:hypothetical protein
LLEGKTVNLRVAERDDIDFLAECDNDVNCMGEYVPVDEQKSKSDWMKLFDNIQSSPNDFQGVHHSEEGRNQDRGYPSSA